MKKITSLLLALLFSFSVFGCSQNQDLAMFRGNLGRTGSQSNDEKIPSGQLDWKFKAEYGCYSSPVISQGIVYFNSGAGYVYAIDANTGKPLWEFKRTNFVGDTPAILNNVLYVGGLDHFFYAINTKMGMENWRFEAGDMIMSSPAIYSGKVYFGSYDGNLYALDANTGHQLWKFKTEVDSLLVNENIKPNNSDPNVYEQLGAIVSDPSIANGVIYFSSYNGYLYALDTDTGLEKWKFITNGEPTSHIPVISNKTIYFPGTDGYFYALNQDGQLKWKHSIENPKWVEFSNTAIANNIIYFIGSYKENKPEFISFDDFDNHYLYAIAEDTGRIIWKTKLSSYAHWITVSNDLIYFINSRGFLFAYDANTGKELWAINFTTEVTNPLSSEVVIANEKIFFCDGDYLYAIK
jgi:outer membrane protein assembly factor BamB